LSAFRTFLTLAPGWLAAPSFVSTMPSFLSTFVRMAGLTPLAVATVPIAAVRRHFGRSKPGRSRLLHPPLGLHVSVVQASPSLQSSGVPSWHPVDGSQVSSPSQTSPSLHDLGAPGRLRPASQTAVWHAFGSAQCSLVPHGMHGISPLSVQRGAARQTSSRQKPPGTPLLAPSSHSSPQSTIALPHPFLHRRVVVAADHVEVVDSSPMSSVPLPQPSSRHWCEQPSPSVVLPSSHCSSPVTWSSPQPGGMKVPQSTEQPPTPGGSHSSSHSTMSLPQLSV
jgi:hypothetical protein